jgi:hypothetical protein
VKPNLARVSALVSLLLASGSHGPASPDRPGGRSLAEALERALADGWGELRIEAECRVEGRLPRAEVHGNGVGIWNEERQFMLSRGEVRALLTAVRDAGFASMRPSYGGKTDPVTSGAQPPRLTCRVGLSLDGASLEVVQLQGGRQSSELRRLAERILGDCKVKAAGGIGAVDLDDGLAKVEKGALAPEVLRVLVSRRPEGRPAADGARGWVLRVEGGTASLTGPEPPGAEPVEARLDGAEAAALARLLREEGVSRLPVNLYADELTDLVVRVLGHEKTVQARRFAGLTRVTHGEAQARLERILEALGGCPDRWFKGRPPERRP